MSDELGKPPGWEELLFTEDLLGSTWVHKILDGLEIVVLGPGDTENQARVRVLFSETGLEGTIDFLPVWTLKNSYRKTS
jgi:hypothetical protein